MGGWPVVVGDEWDEEAFSWTNAIYTNRRIGYSIDYLIDFSVTVDVKNSSWRIIDLDQPPLGMPSRKYLMKGFNDSDVKAYHKYQISLAMKLGAEKKRAVEELRDALQFEMDLAKYLKDSEDRRNISELYNKMTIKELNEMVPEIPWLEYITKVLSLKNLKITEVERINVNVPEYIKKELLKKKVIANYLMWRIASASVGFLSNDVRDLQIIYTKQLTGMGTRPLRWKECMVTVSGSLSHAVGALYAKNFFNENAKAEADEMVKYLRTEFDNILRTVDWMDERTRRRALKKSQAVTAHIAYPKELLVEENLEDLYKNLYISDGDLLDNMRNLTIFGTDFSFGELRKKVDKGHWRNHGAAAVVNAFYSPLENSIQFPAGILQGVFFSADRPKYLNYGGIGFVIGHEITHGYDDRVNGVNTQGENIADNGGIKEAYMAYNQWVSDNGREPFLPGINYTPNQLFWISAAHVWCSKYRPETMKLRLITGSHSPVQFRVNGPISNNADFARDWKCKS
ncbi:Membrane metallo-endopeptidase-like 1 [Armadillidium vulgare]|nr:Membrane metallo-endopeptidase-like 1 [Armadillidium vulgare]